METSRLLRSLAATLAVGGAIGGCSATTPAATVGSPTLSAPAGYVVVAPDQRPGRVPYECGRVDVPPMVLGRVTSQLRAVQVDTVTICHRPGKARFTTYLTPQSPEWASLDGPVATTQQVQALLDVLAEPDDTVVRDCLNTWDAPGAPPVKPIHLTLTDGTNVQPALPTNTCDHVTLSARRAVNAFPWGGAERG